MSDVPEDFELLYPGLYVKAADLKGKAVTKTISDIRLEEMQGKKGVKVKCICHFADSQKMWVVNRTNGEALRAMFGDKPPKWIGKRVTIFPKEGAGFGGDGPAIRVKGSPDIDKAIKKEVQRGPKTIYVDVVPTK